MIRHFFLDKTNTIIEKSHQNMGLNPIMSISYGGGIMRGLIHFDIEEIKRMIDDKTFANTEKLRFFLKMTNCFSVAGVPYENNLIRGLNNNAKRASSFDLMLFKLPCEFDAGRGYDYIDDFWIDNETMLLLEGSTWFQSRNAIPWINYLEKYIPKEDDGGIYKFSVLEKEYDKFKNGDQSIIIGEQHFDYGNENLSIDITDYIFDCLKSGYNYGLCLSFTPTYEKLLLENSQCVNFFTDHTNTFFHPFVEAIYDEHIEDRRNSFIKNSNDKIYLYVYNDGNPCNLDEVPICKVDDILLPVQQTTKGVYYVTVSKDNIDLLENNIYYDKWSNLILNNEKLDDVELQFYVNKTSQRIKIGNNISIKENLIPSIYGIDDNESLNQNEIREVNIDFIKKYTNDHSIISSAKYRLYVKDGEREVDVINFHSIDMGPDTNFFNIYTMDLIPNKYYVDIQISNSHETRTFKNILQFNVIDNITEHYQ